MNQNARISFSSDSITFECHYARAITIDPFAFDVAPPPTPGTPIIGTGNLSYEMTVNVPDYVGGTTTVTISPRHGLTQIASV